LDAGVWEVGATMEFRNFGDEMIGGFR